MLFRSIVGHSEIKKKLIQSVKNGRVSHAQLFLGPEGSGNLALALAYIQFIFCENPGETDSCGVCPSCIKNEHLAHPDIHFTFPVVKIEKRVTCDEFLEEFRSSVIKDPYLSVFRWYEELGINNQQGSISIVESAAISRKLALKSYEGGVKVSLIWMAELINPSAANKLLKTLEEPPDNSILILVANDTDRIIKTILSRTQLIKIPRLNNDEIAEGLIDKFEMERLLAENLASVSEGNYFRAREHALNVGMTNVNFELFREWMRLCFKKDIKEVSHWVTDISKIGREKQKQFLIYGLHIFRQCAVLNYGAEELVTMRGDERVFMQKFAPFITHKNLQGYIDAFNLAFQHISRNANPKILFTDLSFQVLIFLKDAGK